MSVLNKVSRRELWMVSLLPAALVVIASFVVPSPADDVEELETRLEQLTRNTTPAQEIERAQEARTGIREAEAALETLDAREEELEAEIEAARRPRAAVVGVGAGLVSMAEKLDELRVRLAEHRVQVLAIESDGAATDGPEAGKTWRVTVAGRWGEVLGAIEREDTFPRGLLLRSIQMEEPSLRTDLRRWELSVGPVGAAGGGL
ncbi:MAG: hypothetical protein AAGH99_09285 [Planctomycetota bacterium]